MNSPRNDKYLLYPLIFFSGTAALVYELLWMRQLQLIFGVSSFAVAAVLTAYMLGLALGSLLFGKISERVSNLIATYAAMEIGIGVTALGSLFALRNFHLVERLYYQAYALESLYAISLVRLVLCIGILILPTLLIGGTIPILTRHIVSSDHKLGREFGTIYYANAFGALLGVLATGFLLVRWFGVTISFGLAVTLNVVVGLCALRLRNAPRPPIVREQTRPAEPRMLTVLFATGFLVFGYELVWLRLISVYGRATTYSLTVVLAGFLAGIALGSFVFSRRADSLKNPYAVFVRWSLASAGLGLTALLLFSSLPWFLTDPAGFAAPLLPTIVELVLGFLLSASVALPFGVLFPLNLGIYAGQKARIGSWTGSVYFVNTCGAITGSLITGFLLVPLLGIQLTVIGFIVIQLAIAAYGLGLDPDRGSVSPPAFTTFAVLGLATLLLAVLGPHKHYKLIGPRDELLSYEEGLSGTVTVISYPKNEGVYRELLVDSEPVAATFPPDVVDAKLLAHVPLLLAERPRSALTVGFGSGGTSHSMRLHGVEVTAVEIEKAVVRANHLFQENSHGILTRSGFRLVLDDARSFLLATHERFDVIVTDVTNLKYKGNPSLYTVEYFDLMRRRLEPGGVAAAWVPLGGASVKDLKILIASFYAVYPHTTIWFYSLETTHFLIFVGTEQRLSLTLDDLTAPEGAREDLAELGIRGSLMFASMLFLGEEDVARLAAGAPVHTDDRPVLEFSDMKYYLASNSLDNLDRLLEQKRENLSKYFRVPAEAQRPLEQVLHKAVTRHRENVRSYKKSKETGR